MGVKVRKHKGIWYVFIDHLGRRKAKKVGSREAAEKVRREIEARLALGDLGFMNKETQRPPTFAEYADTWLKYHSGSVALTKFRAKRLRVGWRSLRPAA